MDRNDLISRSELKKAIRDWFATERYYHPLDKPTNLSEVIAMTIVDKVPAVKTYCYFCGQTEHGQIKETTFDEYLKEQLKDPEFRKEWEKLCDEDMQKGGEKE